MPLYEFTCGQCRHQFETLIRKESDWSELICPKCRNKKITRLISSFGIGGGSPDKQATKSSCTSCSATSCATCH